VIDSFTKRHVNIFDCKHAEIYEMVCGFVFHFSWFCVCPGAVGIGPVCFQASFYICTVRPNLALVYFFFKFCVRVSFCLQCFDADGWASGRASRLYKKKFSDEMLAWLSVCSVVQMICIWSSWCHCHPIISCFVKIQIGLTFLVPSYQGCPEK